MKHVGMVALVNLQELGLAAVCFRRSKYNVESSCDLKRQSFGGALQITWHGKSEGEEEELTTLERKGIEEVGYRSAMMAIGNKQLVGTSKKDNGDSRFAYASRVPIKFLDFISRIGISSAGVEFIREKDIRLIKPLLGLDKAGVDPNCLKMFSDEIEALRNAFKFFTP